MCLILLSYNSHPLYRLVLAANRDEFYDRPTAPLGFWSDAAHVLAGRDLKRSGTWLGVTRSGRLAAVTNYRQPALKKQDAPSRGHLVSSFLKSNESPVSYLKKIRENALHYEGFNLVLGNTAELCCYSNLDNAVRRLTGGTYGVSNHLLNTPWPKVQKGTSGLQELLAGGKGLDLEEVFQLLADRSRPPDHQLPQTGVGLEWERILGPVFIASPEYGTRCSTVVLMEKTGKITVSERTYRPPAVGSQKPLTRTISFMRQD